MLRSFRELVRTGIGFDTVHLAIADLDLPAKRYPNDAGRALFYRTVLDRVRALPGVASAGIVDNLPLHRVSFANFYIGGQPEPPVDHLPISDIATATDGYFETLGLPLIAGRLFRDPEPRDIAIVNQAFARKFFPGENPVGHTIGMKREAMFQIVGVVGDYRPMGAENGVRPTIFWASPKMSTGTLVVRAQVPVGSLSQALRQAIWSVDRELPSADVLPMSHYVDGSLKQHKLFALLLGIFAVLALILGMMGIYGVLSNLVASRVREIGIRMAIGASPRAIGNMVLRQSLTPVAIGIAAGLAGSLILSRFIESLLFQVRGRDPVTMLLAPCVIMLISPIAIWVPLRRATNIDCTVALRQE
jgi:predicted permease